MRNKYWVLYTGGTIGMKKTEIGLVPDKGIMEKVLAPYSKLDTFDCHICDPLIDSSALNIGHWQAWLELIRDRINEYDGILILHGTDTMAYTANMLAFALQGLNKPVILTGSQWPYDANNSDAPLNLETAVAALNLPICQEVAIAFDGALWQAVGSSKVSTETAAGFSTPHYPPLGLWQEHKWQELRKERFLRLGDLDKPVKVLSLDPDIEIGVLLFQPALPVESVIRYLDNTPEQAVVLLTYGHGNAPDYPEMMNAMREYINRGNVLVNISQVKQGHVASLYAQGHALIKIGVVNGGRWNIETTMAKLIVGLSQGLHGIDLEQMLLDNWVGEWSD